MLNRFITAEWFVHAVAFEFKGIFHPEMKMSSLTHVLHRRTQRYKNNISVIFVHIMKVSGVLDPIYFHFYGQKHFSKYLLMCSTVKQLEGE